MTLLPGQDQEKAPPIHADPAAFIGAAGVDSLPAFWRRGAVTQILKFNGVPFRVSLWRPFARQREPVL
jgi:hypothetical protein